MICVNRDQMIVDGSSPLIATEVSCLLREIRERTPEIIPTILSCVYSDGGQNSLKDTLEEFKKDTTATLKRMEKIEGLKNE